MVDNKNYRKYIILLTNKKCFIKNINQKKYNRKIQVNIEISNGLIIQVFLLTLIYTEIFS